MGFGIIGMFNNKSEAIKGLKRMRELQPNGTFKIKSMGNGMYSLWGSLLWSDLTGTRGSGGLL